MKKLIIGLGNPGNEYMRTPHNTGFAVIDELARRFSFTLRRSFRFNARMAGGNLAGHPAILLKPGSFMNLSGPVVAAVMRARGFSIADLVVIADDANLPEGQLRIRPGGSSGGHKGLESIIGRLGSNDFIRIRLGIGQAGAGLSLREHVLKPFSSSVKEKMDAMAGKAADAVVFLLENGVAAAMNTFNKPISTLNSGNSNKEQEYYHG